MNDKTIFAIVVVICVSALQGSAWCLGFTGQVFAFTSLIIGLVSGSILGFSFGGHAEKCKANYLKDNLPRNKG